MWSDRSTFVQHWNFVCDRNLVTGTAIQRVLKQYKRHPFRISGKADQYLNDLNAEIEIGWTGAGQTNRLLGRITMRSYVFHHVLTGNPPLTGPSLITEIVRVARSLPGYSEWCRHQHEIEHRAEEWARCIENSHYFHYGDALGKYKAQIKETKPMEEMPNWNQQQSESAREKIRSAIAALLEAGKLPSSATQRFKLLLEYRIGGGSLYRHKDLWHPTHLRLEDFELESIDEGIPLIESLNPDTSLFRSNGGNDSARESLSDSKMISEAATDEPQSMNGSDSIPVAEDEPQLMSFSPQIWRLLQQAAVQMAEQQRELGQFPNRRQLTRMEQYLESGDPILVAEAITWFQAWG